MPSLIGAQNFIYDAEASLEANGRGLRIKALGIAVGHLGANIITPGKCDLTQIWTFAADKLQLSSDAANANDPVRKSQIDGLFQGLRLKANVRVATAAALPANTWNAAGTLTMNAVGILTVDGVALVLNDRLIVKDEATSENNGFYFVSTAGTAGVAAILTRTLDANTTAEIVEGSFAWVSEGTANANGRFAVLTTTSGLDVQPDPITFTQISGAGEITGGAGLTKSGNTLDVATADASIVVAADSIRVGFSGTGGLELEAGQGARVKLNGSTLSMDASGLKVGALGVTDAELAVNSVIQSKIADKAVKGAELGARVTYQKIAGNAANTTSLTLTSAVPAGYELSTLIFEDGALLDNLAGAVAGRFQVSGTAVTLGANQITNAVYQIFYVYEPA